MIRLGYPVVGVADVTVAAAFWTEALDLLESPEWSRDTWRTLVRPTDGERVLGLMRSESPPEPHPRIHLDLLVDSTAEQAREVERLVGLGAQRVDWDSYPPAPDFVVLADPDGNLFCVVDLSRAPSGA
ncbi:VOC family protein [Kribbella sp. NPDC051770]|uniref:VOC family protein n=1 Tax=Kribbella sp. NPDC051770 TaxID=3155413 RepID=UPI0034395620